MRRVIDLFQQQCGHMSRIREAEPSAQGCEECLIA